MECLSKGIIILPIKVGLAIENTLCQVVDIEMNCNMILGRPRIHAMKAIPSIYH